jgi:hypothetical protein
MTDRLLFRRLDIHRMPGISRGFEIPDLSPGINVIHGPNASGKTTTARALEALLWPRVERGRCWVCGTVEISSEAWRLEVNGGSASYQREGRDAPAPVLPGMEARDRYRLSLHELLVTDDAGFAEAILTETAGGYDLNAAVAPLGPRAAARPRVAAEGELVAATARLKEARARQDEVLHEARQLNELEASLGAAEAARLRLRVLDCAMEQARARADEAEARALLARFPAAMERLRGDEAERLRHIARRREELRLRCVELEDERLRARSELAAAKLPTEGVTEAAVSTIAEVAREAERLEREVERLELELANAYASRAAAAGALGDVDPSRLPGLDAQEVGRVAALARRSLRLQERRAALEASLAALHSRAGPGESAERLREAAGALRRWLREPGPPAARHRDRIGIAGAVVLIVAGLALAALTPLALSLTAIGAVLLALALRPSSPVRDARRAHRAAFERLDISGPVEWTEEEVQRSLANLEEDCVRAVESENRAARVAELREGLARTEEEWSDLERQRAILAGGYGFAADGADFTALFTFAEGVARWRAEGARAAGCAGALEQARRQVARVLDDLGLQLSAFGEEPPASAAAALASARSL